MLRKKPGGVARRPRLSSTISSITDQTVSRRDFLRKSGIAVGGIAAVSATSTMTATKAQAAGTATGKVDVIKSVCTHCSVGCTVLAEVSNGVWVGQEPAFDSPFNLGAHCAKGAAVREHAHGERRLKYPMKLVGGKWERLSWDDAISEIGDTMLKIREGIRSGFASTGSVRPSTTTNRPIWFASSPPIGARTMSTTRRVFVTRPRSPVLPTPGAMGR